MERILSEKVRYEDRRPAQAHHRGALAKTFGWELKELEACLATEDGSDSSVILDRSRLFGGKNLGSEILVGREKDLANLTAAWVGARKKNILTIVAWGGIGKTSLVAKWAFDKLDEKKHGGIERYFDWSFYDQGTRQENGLNEPQPGASADPFLQRALEVFGDSILAASNASAEKKGDRLGQLIAQKRTLLILDGLEPLQDPRTGALRDEGLRALLRRLALQNPGLCLITTRRHIPDLRIWQGKTSLELELAGLSPEAGAILFTQLKVIGSEKERRDLSEAVKGHALTLTLLGNFLKRAHNGDIRRVKHFDFERVNEGEQGGHAFHVIAAYERWFEENNCPIEIAILRLMGLFDRPATPDCLAALRASPIAGLTDAVAKLGEEQWNEAIDNLVELNLIEKQPWEPKSVVGYSEEQAKSAGHTDKLGIASEWKPSQCPFGNQQLDVHPLIREFFATRLKDACPSVWVAAHSCLFDHLRKSVPYWPEGLDGLQPLYQAVSHGCQARLFPDVLEGVLWDRIMRGHEFHSVTKHGTFGADLAALTSLFIRPWTEPVHELSEHWKGVILSWAGGYLLATGCLDEARAPMQLSLEIAIRRNALKDAAIRSFCLGCLTLQSGRVATAVEYQQQGVDFADRSGDWRQKVVNRDGLAVALLAAGRIKEADQLFVTIDELRKTGAKQCPYPSSYFLTTFWRCDMLLSLGRLEEAESVSAANLEIIAPTFRVFDIAVEELSLTRARFFKARATGGGGWEQLEQQFDDAVDGLRKSGVQEYLPGGLLARAEFLRFRDDVAGAVRDLEEAEQIAARGQMKLHLVDIYLCRAQLLRSMEDLSRARTLIEHCGYLRRKRELADAQKASKQW